MVKNVRNGRRVLLFVSVLNLLGALVIPLTLLLVVVCGTLSGSLLPLLFKRLGLDPALMSNPFVAGLIDFVGIVIYMSVAWLILGPASDAALPLAPGNGG